MRDKITTKTSVFVERRSVDSYSCSIGHNVLTELGEAYIADRMTDEGVTVMSHMAIGTGTGQDAADQTLATEVARVALTNGYPQQGTSGDDNDVIFKATFPAGTPATQETITEVAILNAASNGVMLNYSDSFTPQTKGTAQSLDFTITITIGAS